jgi:hypothetical protein
MKNQKIWFIKHILGKPLPFQEIEITAEGPFKRSKALSDAQIIGDNEWRVWVEHQTTGKRIFESEAEKQYWQSEVQK